MNKIKSAVALYNLTKFFRGKTVVEIVVFGAIAFIAVGLAFKVFTFFLGLLFSLLALILPVLFLLVLIGLVYLFFKNFRNSDDNSDDSTKGEEK